MESPPSQNRKTLIKNISKIKSRIEFRRNEYRDNIGAMFLVNLCKESPEDAADFFIRYAVEGYDIELNPKEQDALDKAGQTTDMVSRIMDVGVGKNVKNNLMNRRRFMFMTGTGLVGAAMIAARIGARSEAAQEIKGEVKKDAQQVVDQKTQEIIDSARDANGNIDAEKLTAAVRKYRKEMIDFSGTAENIMMGMGVVLGVGVFMASYLSSGWDESRKKSEEIIGDLDKFCKHKLKRREVALHESNNDANDDETPPRSKSWQRLHDRRQLINESFKR